MLKRLSQGWAMARASFAVLQRHPKLMVFPLVSAHVFAIAIGLALFSLLPKSIAIYRIPGEVWAWLGGAGSGQPLFLVFLCGVIYALVAAAIFLNVALIACALRALKGETPRLTEGLAAATARLPQILGWALITSTTGLVLEAIQSSLRNLGFIGDMIGNLFAFGWAAATYFVLPVLVTENVGPITAIRRSSAILRGRWGEAAAGEGSFGLLAFVFGFAAFGLFAFGLSLRSGSGTLATAPLALLFMGAGLFVGIATAVLVQTLSAIFQAGVYLYATTGRVPDALDPALVEDTFQRKP